MLRTRIATTAALGAALILASYAAANAAGFSDASVVGTCTWSTVSFETTSGGTSKPPAGPASVLARITFNGKGKFTMAYDASIDGTFSRHTGVSGIYTVDVTGHGTFSYISPASGKAIGVDFYVSPHGTALDTMFETYDSVVPQPRDGNGRCVFDE